MINDAYNLKIDIDKKNLLVLSYPNNVEFEELLELKRSLDDILVQLREWCMSSDPIYVLMIPDNISVRLEKISDE